MTKVQCLHMKKESIYCPETLVATYKFTKSYDPDD